MVVNPATRHPDIGGACSTGEPRCRLKTDARCSEKRAMNAQVGLALVHSLAAIIAAVAAAGLTAHFGFLRWHAERRTRKVGLYVIPFLRACEDLQSRLYNLLQRDGLGALQDKLSADEVAVETLFMIARYCGWERVMYEHGPDVGDPRFVRITQDLRQAFATDLPEFGGAGPFCIFRNQQSDLGHIVVARVGTAESEIAFESLPSYEFRRRLEATGLWTKPVVVDCVRDFVLHLATERTRSRLIAVHDYLVDLLEHLETREGIHLFAPIARAGEAERRPQKRDRVNAAPPDWPAPAAKRAA